MLMSGIIYTADTLMHAYVETKQIGLLINRYIYERNQIVTNSFLIIGIILWFLSIIKKEN
jgi:hypothetical protein